VTRITVELCNAGGANLSSSGIVVTATAVDGDPAKAVSFAGANDGNRFSEGFWGPNGDEAYRYWLDTGGLAAGAHTLSFTVGGDPVVHTVPFTYCGDGGC
jgi:hypothetical protein